MKRPRATSALLLAGAVLVVAPGARAEPAGTGGDETTADAEPPSKGPKAVVVADIGATATANSQLRATLYELARERGYEPAGKLDVEAVASRASLMKAGSITADSTELTELRHALEVSALVRVSKEPAGSVRVTVVTKGGVQSRVLGAADSGDGGIRAALADLLPAVYHADAASAAASATSAPKDPNDAGSLLLDPHTQSTTLRPREAWEKRGGLRPSYGATLLASGTEIRHVAFNATDAAGRPTTGYASATGVGGGIGVRAGFLYLPVPDPNLSTGGFVTFRFGAGIDTNVLYVRTPKGYDASHDVAYRSQALWVVSAPLHLGFAIAAGRFPGPLTWRGVLIGFAYAPAGQFSMDLKNTTGTFRFNPAGAEATVDITNLDASESDAAEPQIRLALSGLMPIDDDHPGFLSLGIGAIWY